MYDKDCPITSKNVLSQVGASMTSRSVICYIGFLFVIWQYGEANVVEEYDNDHFGPP